jgi:hypothetical protein
MPVELHIDSLRVLRASRVPQLVEKRAEFDPQLFPNKADDTAGHFPARMHQVAAGVLREVNHPVIRTDEYAWRGMALHQTLMHLSVEHRGAGALELLPTEGSPFDYRKNGQAWLRYRNIAAPVQTKLPVVHPEQLGRLRNLCRSEDQVSSRTERIVKEFDHLALDFALQVDQQIAA